MFDFTPTVYYRLLNTLQKYNYKLIAYKQFQENSKEKAIILRHDVDANPEKSLAFAKVEKKYGIRSTFYFRCISGKFHDDYIRQIYEMGNEIGYHYEDLYLANGDYHQAIQSFEKNLANLRKLCPVTTISMHGSLMSKFDNRLLWEKFDYRDFGIDKEPYFDLDFNKVLYLTDTGRRWDGEKVSIWDKTMADRPVTNPDFLKKKYHSTFDLVHAIESGTFPKQAMMTFHPQRWHDIGLSWISEFLLKNSTNIIKRYFFVK